MSSRLAIIIVNWNSGTQLRDCLASLARARSLRATELALIRVIVVDNASTDGSAQNLDAGETPLELILNTENRGFGAACNQGARAAGDCDALLFLNPDTLLYEHSLDLPMARLTASDRIGIVGIQLIDESGEVARSCARFPAASQVLAHALALDRLVPRWGQAMREWDHRSTRTVDQVIGAFFLIRRPLFEALGGFDERFFVYYEEVDLARRARQAGWSSLYLAEAQAFHRGGGTSGQALGRRLFYVLRSRLAYFAKHGSWLDRTVVGLTTWLVEPITRLALLLLGRRFRELNALFEAYRWLALDALGRRS